MMTTWHGEDGSTAATLSGGHVGGASAAISYGWSTLVEHAVTVYGASPDVSAGTNRLGGEVWVRRVDLPAGLALAPDIGISVRVDGTGRPLRVSDPLRALVECLLDDELEGEDIRRILRSAAAKGFDAAAIVAHADLHGRDVEEAVRTGLGHYPA